MFRRCIQSGRASCPWFIQRSRRMNMGASGTTMNGALIGSAARCSRFGDSVTVSARITMQPALDPAVCSRWQVSKISADRGERKDIGQPSCLLAFSRTSSAIRSPRVKFRPFPFKARRRGTCLPHTRRVGSVRPVAARTCPCVSFITLLTKLTGYLAPKCENPSCGARPIDASLCRMLAEG